MTTLKPVFCSIAPQTPNSRSGLARKEPRFRKAKRAGGVAPRRTQKAVVEDLGTLPGDFMKRHCGPPGRRSALLGLVVAQSPDLAITRASLFSTQPALQNGGPCTAHQCQRPKSVEEDNRMGSRISVAIRPRKSWPRPKYFLFGVIGVMLFYVLVHDESFLVNSHDPEKPHRPI